MFIPKIIPTRFLGGSYSSKSTTPRLFFPKRTNRYQLSQFAPISLLRRGSSGKYSRNQKTFARKAITSFWRNMTRTILHPNRNQEGRPRLTIKLYEVNRADEYTVPSGKLLISLNVLRYPTSTFPDRSAPRGSHHRTMWRLFYNNPLPKTSCGILP